MDVGHLDGVASIPDRRKCAHLLENELRIQRIVLGSARPPSHGRIPHPGAFGRRGQMLERLDILTGQAGPLSVQPIFELRRVIHVEALKQWPSIGVHRLLRPGRRQPPG